MAYLEEPCGWRGDFQTLLETDSAYISGCLARFLTDRGSAQFHAWDSSVGILQRAARHCVNRLPDSKLFAAILEYELARDRGRRPDVVVLEDGRVVVIEFKEGGRIRRADLDQVRAYSRDLASYHSECHARTVVPVLVPTEYKGAPELRGGVHIVSPSDVGGLLLELARQSVLRPPDPVSWLRAEYAPLPGLTEAALELFHGRALPRIKRAESAKIPEVVARIADIANETRSAQKRSLVFLTGVPGSGKTLVGLQLVHHPGLGRLRNHGGDGPAAIFLSGNGPLVKVLQYVLKSKHFVQDLKGYLLQYETRTDTAPPEHVVVIDEAQRAWDAHRVAWKHKGQLGRRSEPELVLGLADRIPNWALVLALLGEGQEIHSGEEGGLGLWRDALASQGGGGWTVYGPDGVAPSFRDATDSFIMEPLLDLSASLRSHAALNWHRWVALLLDGRIEEARAMVGTLSGYDLYVCRGLDAAKRYVRRRYTDHLDRRFGLLASSCAENLRGFVLRLKEDRGRGDYDRWYEGRREGRGFCGSLVDAVSEFGCQGLELDYAIVCWGDDLSWAGGEWTQRGGKRPHGVKDRDRIRANAYRVLLTRGRDGTCIFVPPEPSHLMTGTFETLLSAGAVLLDGP